MEAYESDALIKARPSTVWDVLTDTSNLTTWDSGFTGFTGDLHDGGRIRIKSARGGDRTLRIRVSLMAGKSMTWTLRGPFGLSKGVRAVAIEPEQGMTRLKVTVTFTGPLHRVLSRMLPGTEKALEDYVSAVIHRAELLDRSW